MSAEPLAGMAESGQRVARGQEWKPERFKGFSAGSGALTADTARPITPTGMLKPRTGPLESRRPGSDSCGLWPARSSCSDTEAPEAASRPRSTSGDGPRRARALGDPATPLPPVRPPLRPFRGAEWARLGDLLIKSKRKTALGTSLTLVSVYLCVSPLLLSVSPALYACYLGLCHFVFLSNPSPSIWILSSFLFPPSVSLDPVFPS